MIFGHHVQLPRYGLRVGRSTPLLLELLLVITGDLAIKHSLDVLLKNRAGVQLFEVGKHFRLLFFQLLHRLERFRQRAEGKTRVFPLKRAVRIMSSFTACVPCWFHGVCWLDLLRFFDRRLGRWLLDSWLLGRWLLGRRLNWIDGYYSLWFLPFRRTESPRNFTLCEFRSSRRKSSDCRFVHQR